MPRNIMFPEYRWKPISPG